MAGPLEERRNGTERRRQRDAAPTDQERRQRDRRQFPPPDDPHSIADREKEVQDAIDTYKQERGLTRITIAELLDILQNLGYRQG